MSVLGRPPEEELTFVTHPAARKAIMSKANPKPKDFESYFPADASPLALDLLRRMVGVMRFTYIFNPVRILSTFTMEDRHPDRMALVSY